MRPNWRLYRAAEPQVGVRTAGALLIAYIILIFIGVAFFRDAQAMSVFWPANGVTVAAILVLPRKLGFGLVLGFWLVNLCENIIGKLPIDLNILYCTVNTVLAVSVAFLTRTFCGAALDLSRVRRVLYFCMIAIVCAALEATLGELYLIHTSNFTLNYWFAWVTCDALGLIIATPAVLMFIKRNRVAYLASSGRVERFLLLMFVIFITFVAFTELRYPLFLLIYPLLVLIAFRAGAPWAAISVICVSVVASALTIAGHGPVVLLANSSPFIDLPQLQLFLISIFLVSIPATNALGELATQTQRTRRIHAVARKAQAAAEVASYTKSQFVANMSHEIRTPLNGVLGMAQVMANDELTEIQRERLDVVRMSGETVLTILNDILDLSKIEAGKMTLEVAPFRLFELAHGAAATFSTMAQKKGLSFELNIDPAAEGTYLGDATRVRQILYNLTSNALKFTEQGQLLVAITRENGTLDIRVKDSGIGIPEDRLSKIFEKFEQADISTTRRFGGTGLGLSICYDLAQLMGGSISVESVVGVGSTFIVVLPLEYLGNDGEKFSDNDSSSNEEDAIDFATDVKIMIAEDNKTNQLVLKTLLHQLGLQPVVVENGMEAVAAWEKENWDLILMDMQMPIMDGLTASKNIRGQEAVSGRLRTPIVALTANVMSHQVASYVDAGLDGFIGKPIEFSKLIETINAVLETADDGDDGAGALLLG